MAHTIEAMFAAEPTVAPPLPRGIKPGPGDVVGPTVTPGREADGHATASETYDSVFNHMFGLQYGEPCRLHSR